jgi:hypothetical protein
VGIKLSGASLAVKVAFRKCYAGRFRKEKGDFGKEKGCV